MTSAHWLGRCRGRLGWDPRKPQLLLGQSPKSHLHLPSLWLKTPGFPLLPLLRPSPPPVSCWPILPHEPPPQEALSEPQTGLRILPLGVVHSVPRGKHYYCAHLTEEKVKLRAMSSLSSCTAEILTRREDWLL